MSPITTSQQHIAQQLRITAYLVAMGLLLQLPLCVYATVNLWAIITSLLVHATLMLVIAGLTHFPHSVNTVRLLLCTVFCSYIICAVLLWQRDLYIQHFLLLGVLTCAFFFRYHERRLQLAVMGAFITIFLTLEWMLIMRINTGDAMIRLANSVSLSVASLAMVATLGRLQRRRWTQLRAVYSTTRHTLETLRDGNHNQNTLSLTPGETRRIATVCVLFADLSGFQQMNDELDDEKTVMILDALFREFDVLAMQHKVMRLKTNGDEYMAATGLTREPDSANAQCQSMCLFALALLSGFRQVASLYALPCQIRIGVACGPATAGILGQQHAMLDIWGKTVNYASTLESAAPKNGILVCSRTRQAMADNVNIDCKNVVVETKRGTARVYLLETVEASACGAHNAANIDH
ncbi:adenylate/guanylate cyclase domain-containing protein [Alteromonas sp. CYL-A6]|uniref:adenylate/guanylate cyclase domain-containing protein n=1 Tax=Alteromonas nitratireducens TaxID=3390813 RepID=UPI0034B962BA